MYFKSFQMDFLNLVSMIQRVAMPMVFALQKSLNGSEGQSQVLLHGEADATVSGAWLCSSRTLPRRVLFGGNMGECKG